MRFGANSVGLNVKTLKRMTVKANIFGEHRSFSQGQSDATLRAFYGKQSELVTTSGVRLGDLRLKQTQADISGSKFRETSPPGPERFERKKAFCRPTLNPHLSISNKHCVTSTAL